MLLLAALALTPTTETILSCSTGTRQIEVTSDGATLTYRFGRPGKPEIVLTGRPFYHHQLYPRGESHSLRFVRGDYHYVVYSIDVLPSGVDAEGYPTGPGFFGSGVVVTRHGKRVALLKCTDEARIYSSPILETLPRDTDDRIPEDL